MAIRKIISRSIGVDVIVASDIADGAIGIGEIANDAVTADKLANSVNASIAAKAPIASPSFTGNVVTQGVNPTITIQDSDEAGDGFIKFKTANGTQRGYIQTAMTSDVMIFGTGTTERMRLISSGGLTFNGDTAAANALDDYEEGTWTPVTSLGTATANAGTYTKIGRQVYVGGDITFPVQSSSAAAIISGLPFSSADADGAATAGYTNFLAEQLLLTANAGATISCYGLTTSAVGGLSWTQMSGKRVVFSYVYHV